VANPAGGLRLEERVVEGMQAFPFFRIHRKINKINMLTCLAQTGRDSLILDGLVDLDLPVRADSC
jgi:hypothetical protein